MADPPDPDGDYLPPQPPGPEPELGKAPPPPQPEPGLPPHQPPPPQWGQPAPGQWQQPPPGWQPPPSQPQWQQPHPGAQQQWAYPAEPDNGPAVTGFVLAMVSLGLWVLSAGLSTLISLGLAIAGLLVSRTGKRRVADGVTRKNKGLAQAGFICSIVMVALAALSTIAWTVFFVLFAVDEDFRNDLDDGDNSGSDFNGITTTVRLGVLAVRLGAHLVS